MGHIKSSIYIETYLDELILQIGSWADPGRNSVAEKYKVVYDSSWIDGYHIAHATESGILLFVIANVAQRHAPGKEIRE